jgi:hypothetical protein
MRKDNATTTTAATSSKRFDFIPSPPPYFRASRSA